MSFKRSFIGVAIAVFAFAGLASGAKAIVIGPIPGGVLENGETANFGQTVNGVFTHEWTFVLEGPAGDPTASNSILEVILENTNTATANNIVGLTLQLFAGTPGAPGPFIPPAVGPVVSVPSTPATAPNSGPVMIPLLGNSLAPGDYFFQITGTGVGNGTGGNDNQGFYNVQVTATPLPAAIWLMLSALLGLVSFSRIRRRSSEAA